MVLYSEYFFPMHVANDLQQSKHMLPCQESGKETTCDGPEPTCI